jgi:2-polyprenyl-3-methyl-5-hydroxy-6-metoxy-1,4-benzoquinol methylase
MTNGRKIESVKNFWETEACGSQEIKDFNDKKEFYEKYRNFRYYAGWYIPLFVPFKDSSGKKVLEIGCGNGADGIIFASNGANYTGVDITQTAVDATKDHFQIMGYKGNFKIENAEKLSYQDNSFDIVYSFGVLHHTPNPQQAIDEVYRVLIPEGKAIIMLYNKHSFNYYLRIMIYMRLRVVLKIIAKIRNWSADRKKFANAPLTGLRGNRFKGIWGVHYKNFLLKGWDYLNAKEFIHHCTDGPECPIAYVFTKKDIKVMFSKYNNLKINVAHFPLRRFKLGQLIPFKIEKFLASKVGWNLLITATK